MPAVCPRARRTSSGEWRRLSPLYGYAPRTLTKAGASRLNPLSRVGNVRLVGHLNAYRWRNPNALPPCRSPPPGRPPGPQRPPRLSTTPRNARTLRLALLVDLAQVQLASQNSPHHTHRTPQSTLRRESSLQRQPTSLHAPEGVSAAQHQARMVRSPRAGPRRTAERSAGEHRTSRSSVNAIRLQQAHSPLPNLSIESTHSAPATEWPAWRPSDARGTSPRGPRRNEDARQATTGAGDQGAHAKQREASTARRFAGNPSRLVPASLSLPDHTAEPGPPGPCIPPLPKTHRPRCAQSPISTTMERYYSLNARLRLDQRIHALVV